MVFLDADDRLMPTALASNLKVFDEKPESAFVYGGYDYIDATGRHLSSPPLQRIGEDAYESLLKGNCVAMNATVMYRRDCLEEVDGFDPRFRCCEDYELYLRLARQYRIAASDERIAEYRRHGSNMSLNLVQMLDTVLEVMRQQSQYVDDNARRRDALKIGIRHLKWGHADEQISQSVMLARESGLRQIPWRAIARIFSRAPASFLKASWRRILKWLHSRLRPSPRRSIRFGDLRRLRPISTNFGFDRGKPVDRRYIEDFLSCNAQDIEGRVLEIGDNVYTVRYGGARVTRSDILQVSADNPRATLVGDLAEGDNFPSEAFDCIVLVQTLQYVFDLHKAIATLHRMLKPGGVLLATVPGVSAIDREPSWAPLWTLSATALSRLLAEEFDGSNISVITYGNVLAAVAFLHGLAESELHPTELDTIDPQYPVILAARAVKRNENQA